MCVKDALLLCLLHLRLVLLVLMLLVIRGCSFQVALRVPLTCRTRDYLLAHNYNIPIHIPTKSPHTFL